jgi:O-antigen ligase
MLDSDDRSVFLRRRFMEMTVEAVADNPLFGIGFGNFAEYALRRQPDMADDLIPSAMEPHSIYAQLLVSGSFVALALFGLHVARLWRLRRLRGHRLAYVVPAVLLLVVGIGQELLVNPTLWALLGLAMASERVLEPSASQVVGVLAERDEP